MAKFLQILRNPYTLLAVGFGVFVVFFILAFLSTQDQNNSDEPSSVAQPAYLPENLDLYEEKEPTTQSFTQEEQMYAEATPQAFPQATEPTRTGTLVVVSDPPDVNVVLEEDSGEEVSEYRLPYNRAPFKASGVPVGEYTITAAKDGYEYMGESFTIEENKITRVIIKLTPLR